MSEFTKRIIVGAVLAVSGIGLAMAQPAPGGATTRPAPPADERPAPAEPTTLTGLVGGFNLGPDGQPNGLMLRSGDGPMTQINFPPHLAEAITKAVDGKRVTVTARPLPPRPDGRRGPDGGPGGPRPDAGGPGGPPRPDDAGDRPAPPPPASPVAADHPVLELQSIKPEGGAEITVGRPGDGRGPEGPTEHVDGKIRRLNYTREGQVDGAVLEDGTLVHTGPGAAATLKLTVGQTLGVDGTRPPRGNGKVIAARTVNGTDVPRHGPGGPRGPRGGEDGPDGGPGGGPDGGPGRGPKGPPRD